MTIEAKKQIVNLLAEARDLSTEELVRFAIKRFDDKITFATSFGAEDQVVTDILRKVTDKPLIFTLDTGRLPEQTYKVLEQTRRRYGIGITVLFPDSERIEKYVNSYGPNAFYESVELRKECCRIRKIEPLRRYLAGLDAWICGLRSEQSPTRKELARIEYDEAFGLIKINPLADWNTQQVWDYIREHNVPYNTLHDDGFPSIGCEPCTRAILAGEDIRAGRWWWEEPEHKECGLHRKIK
ncbi:MAG: phosphoadenylyl-sulfate reductase [Phycisphaerae bacterium]|nr:phosphoadenylyl-sulfate reductase [Phycisphaerae bacterium]